MSEKDNATRQEYIRKAMERDIDERTTAIWSWVREHRHSLCAETGYRMMREAIDAATESNDEAVARAMKELPRYKSHKLVHALKIHAIDLDLETGAAVITPEEAGYGPFPVDAEYMGKHKPRIGGYYVVYEDGYKSWSPADAFENGYTQLDAAHSPLSELQAALKADDDYAWTWLCNLACIGVDSGGDHESANRRAAQFMRNAFGVDISTQENWQTLEAQWAQDRLTWSEQCEKLLLKMQFVIHSNTKRTYEEMKAVAERLTEMGAAVAGMELGEMD